MTTIFDSSSLDGLRLPSNFVGKPKPKKRRPRIKGRFLKGPVPMNWLMTAFTECGGTSAYVGAVLWHLSGMKQNARAFPVSNVVAGDYGLTAKMKHLAFKKLAGAGLVQLEKRGRKAKTITIVISNDD